MTILAGSACLAINTCLAISNRIAYSYNFFYFPAVSSQQQAYKHQDDLHESNLHSILYINSDINKCIISFILKMSIKLTVSSQLKLYLFYPTINQQKCYKLQHQSSTLFLYLIDIQHQSNTISPSPPKADDVLSFYDCIEISRSLSNKLVTCPYYCQSSCADC